MSKYNSKKTIVDGIVFDSRREAKRYLELKALEDAGVIQHLKRQVKFDLIPSQKLPTPIKKKGKVERTLRGTTYRADFTYFKGGELVVEDAKGMETDVYRLKKKLMLEKYGIQIMEV